MTNFYKNQNCKGVLLEMGAPETACNCPELELLQAGSVDASAEKHVPVASVEGNMVKIQVGSEPHPMIPEHHIEWIYVKTSFGGIFCDLNVGDPPEALMHLVPDEVLEVYEYCNLHGLWKAKEPVFLPGFDVNDTACSPEFSAGCVTPSEE